MKKVKNFIYLFFLIFTACGQKTIDNNFNLLLCKKWITKYQEINNLKYSANEGHRNDTLIFLNSFKVLYYVGSNILHGEWRFSKADSLLEIKDKMGAGMKSKIVCLTDSLLILEVINHLEEKVKMHMIPSCSVTEADDTRFYSNKIINQEKFKISIDFPFDPRNVSDNSNPDYSVHRFEYAYPDKSYENYLYGVMVCDLKNERTFTLEFKNYFSAFIKNEYEVHMRGKLMSEKKIIFKGFDAVLTKYRVYNKMSEEDMMVSSIVFYHHNSLIHLFTFSPLNPKGEKELKYFFDSFKVM